MLDMPPGLILDLYVYHMDYDDVQHGITRETPRIYD